MNTQTGIIEGLAEDLREHLRGKPIISVKEPTDGPPEVDITWRDGGLITLKCVDNRLIVTNDLEWAGEIPVFDLEDPTALEQARDYVNHQNRIKHMRRAFGMWKDRDDIIEVDELRPERLIPPELGSLRSVMDRISREAEKRGMTQEILDSILNDER